MVLAPIRPQPSALRLLIPRVLSHVDRKSLE
jgi:hypothetical protein